ncbi:MAG: hypothetical protein E7256_05970 [Lachnospiraceae bacterium]|nr:hypothetical protein [Lachnospiraceae bacterium]
MMLLLKRTSRDREIKQFAKKESFSQVPEFYENSLEVSEHFIRLKGEIIPKNYIIGVYVEAHAMIDFYFIFITGEWKNVFHIPRKGSKEAESSLHVLKQCIPNAMITTTSWLFEWPTLHKKKLAGHYQELEEKQEIDYLIHNFVSFYE